MGRRLDWQKNKNFVAQNQLKKEEAAELKRVRTLETRYPGVDINWTTDEEQKPQNTYRREFASDKERWEYEKRESDRQNKYWREMQNSPKVNVSRVHRVDGILISEAEYQRRLKITKEKEENRKRRQLKKARKMNRKKDPNA